MSPLEHAARAALLSVTHGGNLWYDSAIHAYRPRSPGGENYKYSGCLDADTLEPLEEGAALRRQKKRGIGNTVSQTRLGIPGAKRSFDARRT